MHSRGGITGSQFSLRVIPYLQVQISIRGEFIRSLGKGYSTKFFMWGDPPRGPTLYPFVYHFERKGTPLIEKKVPESQNRLKRSLLIIFIKCLTNELIQHKVRLFEIF